MPANQNANNGEEYLEQILLISQRILAVNEAILERLTTLGVVPGTGAENIDFTALTTAMQNATLTDLTRP